ncbi:MAG: hypothetical protein OHK0026_06740 [Rhodocyclaceae bacterium]
MNIQPVGAGNAAPGIETRQAARESVPRTPTRATPAAAQDDPSATQVREAARAIRAAVEASARELRFDIEVDKGTGRTIVRVFDARTKELIRQIPAEEVLAMSRAIGRPQGLLLEKSA